MKLNDFKLINFMEKGWFFAEKIDGKGKGRKFFMRQMSKAFYTDEKYKNELEILKKIKPLEDFVVKMSFALDEPLNFYFGFKLDPSENLAKLLSSRHFKIKEEDLRFWACNILLGMKGLHDMNIIHARISSSNVLVAENGYLKLTGFESAVELLDEDTSEYDRKYSFSEDQYIAPEITKFQNINQAVDFYSLGILIVEMINGQFTLSSPDFDKYYKKPEIKREISLDLRKLIDSLIQIDPAKRIDSFDKISKKNFFKTIDFDLMRQMIVDKSAIAPKDFGGEGVDSAIVENLGEGGRDVDSRVSVSSEQFIGMPKIDVQKFFLGLIRKVGVKHYICLVKDCKGRCKKSKVIRAHALRHASVYFKEFYCDKCKHAYATKANLDAHSCKTKN